MAGSSSKCSLYIIGIHQSCFHYIRIIQRGQICKCEYVDIQWIILIHVIRVSLLFVLIKPDSFSVSNLTIILVYIGTLMLRSPSMKPFTIHQRYSLAFSLGLKSCNSKPKPRNSNLDAAMILRALHSAHARTFSASALTLVKRPRSPLSRE